MFSISTTVALQHWESGLCFDTILKQRGKPLPDVDALNAAIPKTEWDDDGFDGEPRPPWELNWVTYLLDPQTGSLLNHLNKTADGGVK
jgi:hypothetical protein